MSDGLYVCQAFQVREVSRGSLVSFSRENVTWQSKDGRWNLGFFETTWVGSESDGYDPEWDVEYDFSKFEWVSTGHATEQAAHDSWDGANPGGGIGPVPYKGNSKDCKEYDAMAVACQKQTRLRDAANRKKYGRRW